MTAHRSLPWFNPPTAALPRQRPRWRQRPLLLALAAACSALFTMSARGADDMDENLASMSLENLLNMEVVSATRSESKLSESPVPISVITDKEIANSGLDNIPDILARLGEADVLHIGASQTEVSIRGKGINFNRRMLVLIDGRTEYNDLLGVTFWNAFPISVDDILRIEVVRGPASALFGANAYSGVINIITKPAEGDSGAALRYHGGEMGREYSNLQGHFGGAQFSGKFSVSTQDLGSDETHVEFPGFNRLPTTSNFVDDDASLEHVNRANAQAMWRLNADHDLRLGLGMSEGRYELIPQPGLPRAKWDLDTEYWHFIYNGHFSDAFSMQFNVYKNTFDYATALVPTTEALLLITDPNEGRRYFPGVETATKFAGTVDTTDSTLQFVGKAGYMNWVAGGEYREIENSGGDTDSNGDCLTPGAGCGLVKDSSKDILSIFANATVKFGDSGWLSGLGVRADDDSTTGVDYGYNASLSYFFSEKNSLRATARRAFRAPSLFEQNSEINLSVPNKNQRVKFRGNSELGVETITSEDITWTFFVGERMQLTLEVFHEQYTEIIGNPDSGVLDNVEIDPNTGVFTTTTSFQNLADADSTGFQASALWVPSETLSLYANYRFTDPQDLNAVPGETFLSPEHKIGFGGLWQLGDVLLDVSNQYIAKTDESEFLEGNNSPNGPNFTRDYQQSYNILNLTLHYRPGAIKGLGVYVAVNNALDDAHVEYFEYDEVLKAAGEEFGRSIWGGLSWKF